MDKIDVQLSGSYKMVMWIVGICTLGVGAIAMWFSARCWPSLLDDEGITLRNGRRVLWGDISTINKVCVVNQLGRRVTGRLELVFGDVTVKIVPQSIIPGPQVMAFISEKLGQDVTTG